MDSLTIEPAPSGENQARTPPPKASTWLCHPWHAKLWWGASLLYWSGKLASYWSASLDAIYSTATAGLLNVFFFPPAIAMVLASGLVRAWMDYKGLAWRCATADPLLSEYSVGGWSDPSTDPLDPRSGHLWINSPANEAKLVNHR